MCGIRGIINKNNKVELDEIKNINDLIKHRGPDDEGFYFGDNFAFGHRRLSILDLSRDGHQPMNFNNKYTITYNGEIYNYLEIKEELIVEGYKFNSSTDTEVILASYDKWGEKCVSKFNGMWAFAIYDKERNIIFCSRDRFGIKPFYYTEIENKFIFGSEIKQLLEYHKNRYVNKEVLMDYLVIGFEECSDETFFKDIYKLRGGYNLIYDLKDFSYRKNKYYTILVDSKLNSLNEEQTIESYKKELERSINIRLRSDVKVGTCLSGGLDSSSIASIAGELYSKASKEPFSAINAKSMEKSFDESEFAKKVANDANLNLNIIEPNTDDFIKNIDNVIRTQEEPFGSPSIFMQYFVMKKAKEIGCTVMLDGQGGDETLLGYDKYYPAAYLAYFKENGLFKTLKEIKNSNKNNSKMSLKWIIIYTVGFLFAYLRKKKCIRDAGFIKKKHLHEFQLLNELSQSYLDINKLQILEIEKTNLPILLRYEDKNSMKHSIETRLPFIDFKTLETGLGINIKYKIKDGWTKYILRKIMEGNLSKKILWRKNKFGFPAPTKTWIQAHKNEMIKTINESNILNEFCDMKLLNKKFIESKSRLQWGLFNIAKWEKIYNVKVK